MPAFFCRRMALRCQRSEESRGDKNFGNVMFARATSGARRAKSSAPKNIHMNESPLFYPHGPHRRERLLDLAKLRKSRRAESPLETQPKSATTETDSVRQHAVAVDLHQS